MNNLPLTFACNGYDHIRDLANGRVRAEGIDLTYLDLPVEEIFFRFLKYREWDISELSFGKYISLVSQGDPGFSALPVFVSRVFRLSSFYVRADGVKSAAELRGKRIGMPEWAQTASLYSRGHLVHDAGVPLTEVEWVQAGLNQAGRVEKVALKLPLGVRYSSRSDKSLSELLLSGEIDCILSARPPQPFVEGHPGMVRLYPDYRGAEEAHYRKTGIFPIMHVIVVRNEVLQRNPWAAMNLYKAFEEAKRRSLVRMLDVTASFAPFAWAYDEAARVQTLMGGDAWPYGIEKNRATLEAVLQYGFEQGVCHRKLAPEDLFHPNVLASVKV